jgi:hypothetical protein
MALSRGAPVALQGAQQGPLLALVQGLGRELRQPDALHAARGRLGDEVTAFRPAKEAPQR